MRVVMAAGWRHVRESSFKKGFGPFKRVESEI